MRKITSLFMLLLLCVGTAWGQISVGSVYSIQNKTSKRAISQDANLELAVVTANTADNAQLWIAEQGSSEGTYKLRNLASGAYAQYVAQTSTHWYTDYVATDFYIGEMSAASGDTPVYYYISRSAVADATTAQYTAMHESGGFVVQWEQTNNNSQWSFVAVEEIDVESAQAEWTKMTQVKAWATSFSKLTILSTFINTTNIENITAEGTNAEQLKSASDAMKTIVSNAMKSADGKSVIFNNKATDARANLSPTAFNTNKVFSTATDGNETIWTIKSQEDGSFKLYNFTTNKYMPEPGVEDLKDEAEAASFKFIVTDDNTAALISNYKMLHQSNWAPDYQMINYWSIYDAASLWEITEVGDIEAEAESYRNATSATTVLPYAIQQGYGLVTEASCYYSNWKSTAEGSYEALLDNNTDTYFHSSYTPEAQTETAAAHYIQADLGEGKSVDQFYFYMFPRTQNRNNRPVNITVSGSNDNSTFTEIAQITTTLYGNNTPYLSDKLGTAGTSYRYIRLTVTSTNSGTKFFTLSELYFYPASTEVDNLVNTYKTFATTSITSSDINNAAETMVTTTNALVFNNTKDAIAELLDANESNHAETPALGQYPTDAYNALKAAYESSDATQETLDAAIAAFNEAKNIPVYFITGISASRAADKAILYNGNEWRFDAANKYNRQMWITIPAHAEENVPTVESYSAEGTHYALCDYLTGTVMRGQNVQIVAIAGLENAYNLQCAASGTGAAMHAQNGGALVQWNPATFNAETSAYENPASAWQVEYIGGTYDLDKLTEEQLAAMTLLQASYNENADFVNATIGTGLGEYDGSNEAIIAAVPNAATILNKSLKELVDQTTTGITVATTALTKGKAKLGDINLPEEGKFYRIQGAQDFGAYSHYYITGHTNSDGGRIALTESADASTIYLYTDGKLLSYSSGLYIGLNASDWTFSTADGSKAASAITIAASPRKAGSYTIKSENKYLHYKIYNGTVELDRCDAGTDKEDNWTISEVTTLPVEVSAVGYATLYAPVALDVPTGVTAYTGTVNGDVLQLTAIVEETIPANTGVILVAEEDTYDFTLSSSDATGSSALEGTIATIVKPKGNIFTLQNLDNGIGLYPYTGTELKGFRAYLTLAEGAPVNGLRFEDVTGIENALIQSNDNAAIFDLSGRRVAKMQKGLYIVNGKKVLVK